MFHKTNIKSKSRRVLLPDHHVWGSGGRASLLTSVLSGDQWECQLSGISRIFFYFKITSNN
jgi:hypothetical protein